MIRSPTISASYRPRIFGLWRERGIDEIEKPKIDAEIAELTEDEAASEQERLKRKWASVEALVGSEKRLALVAEDLVKHFEDRGWRRSTARR